MSEIPNPDRSGALLELDELRAKVEQLQRELREARRIIAKTQKLPIEVSYRRDIIGIGEVLEIKNFSTEPLPLSVKLTRPTSGATHTVQLVLDPLPALSPTPKEIGRAEGWVVVAGDTIEITSKGFDPILLTRLQV